MPFNLAALSNCTQILRVLVANDHRGSGEIKMAFRYACSVGSLVSMQFLFPLAKFSIAYLSGCLKECIDKPNAAVVNFLIGKLSTINFDLVKTAVQRNGLALLKLFSRYNSFRSLPKTKYRQLFEIASRNGEFEIFSFLLRFVKDGDRNLIQSCYDNALLKCNKRILHFIPSSLVTAELLQKLKSIRFISEIVKRSFFTPSDDNPNSPITVKVFVEGSVADVNFFIERGFPLTTKMIEDFGLMNFAIEQQSIEKLKFLQRFQPNIDSTPKYKRSSPYFSRRALSPRLAALENFFTNFFYSLTAAHLICDFRILQLVCLKTSKLSKFQRGIFGKPFRSLKYFRYFRFTFLPRIECSLATVISHRNKFEDKILFRKSDVEERVNLPLGVAFISPNMRFGLFRELLTLSRIDKLDEKSFSLLLRYLISERAAPGLISIAIEYASNSGHLHNIWIDILDYALMRHSYEVLYFLCK